ncbi:BTB/POZ fold [Phaffia rhodozyma]|uniref:BTB/POZ fold n=1 Tax=Phaffia rhodozyma TaxID=264483 RepID=A0A0F7SH09_PHARH|nr:BTB/POZ fold [Phaffia rhodozyma]
MSTAGATIPSNSPISSVAPPTNSPISSIQPQSYQPYPSHSNQLLTRLDLDVRGQRRTINPSSDDQGDVYTVDFDPGAFSFVLDFFEEAITAFYGTPSSPGLFHSQQSLLSSTDLSTSPLIDSNISEDYANLPLLQKQGIIVLREELEYFVIPPKGGVAQTDAEGNANEELIELKRLAGKALLDRRQIFTALQRNVNKENNVAEQHLIDMLCMSGFDRQDEWGHRDVEPSRCSITSIALVLLKTGIQHPTKPDQVATIDHAQMTTSQKLLLFWRKPARKCWWDGVDIETRVDAENKTVKVWARRVWTLELNLV